MTRQERIDGIVRDIYTLAPMTVRDALGGRNWNGKMQPPNRWDQYWVLDRVLENWRNNG